MQSDARDRMGSGLSTSADAFGTESRPLAPVHSAAELARQAESHLQSATRHLEAIRAVQGRRTIENTLGPYDEIAIELDQAGNLAGLLERVHPDADVRAVSEKWTQEVSQFATRLSLDRSVYDAICGLDLAGADAVTKFYVERTLRDFRRSGVDRDEATRQRVQELQDELTLVGQDFARNIQSDRRSIRVRREDLEGLPPDYVAAHAPGTDGGIEITTDYPDYVPFMSYSRSGAMRQALYRAFRNRGYPANLTVLDRMLACRHQLAQLLGYRSWAHYVTEDKMIQTDTAAEAFVRKTAHIAAARAAQDYDELLRCKQGDDAAAGEIFDWEKDYYEERVKAEKYELDSQAVRPYFAYERVKQGVLDVTSRLFGIEFRRVHGVDVWADDVETYDVFEHGEPIGRFHLDMHPRQDKYKHAAQFNIRNGVAGRQLPEAALVCNFPAGGAGDPGLLEHDDVTTFFHEFGHLLHSLFAGRQRWMGVAGISTEWDFVEAPSQMLEEWAWDVATLRTFALHHETGEPIPEELVLRMRRAREFARGTHVRQQMYYAMLSLQLYAGDRAGLDTTALVRQLQNEYSPFRYVEGTYFHLSFGHLDGYSAIYYTYMWSLVIARDLFSQFSAQDLSAREVAQRYRKSILEAGGSAPAAVLIERFLGRPFDFEAFEAWLGSR